MLSIGNKMPVGIVKRPMFQAKTKPLAQPQFSALFDTFRSSETIYVREAILKQKRDIEAEALKYVEALEELPMTLSDDRGCVNLGGRKFLVMVDKGRTTFEAETVDNQPKITLKSDIDGVSSAILSVDWYETNIHDEEKSIDFDLSEETWDTPMVTQRLCQLLKDMDKRANRG